ncbi:HlyD family secretion protein [Pseudochelatococcus sp. B33]
MVQAGNAHAQPQGGKVTSLRGKPQVEAVPDSVSDAVSPEPPPPRRGRRRLIVFGVLAALLAAGAWYGNEWWHVGRFQVSTDDAYVGADTSVLAAKVGGYVVGVDVATNQWVKAGEVIARIDDGDYGLALRAAQDKMATQEAALGRFDEQIRAGQAEVDRAQAQLVAAKAELTRASVEFDRQSQLARSDYTSRAALDNARAARDKAQANVDEATAAIASAQAAIAVLEAQRNEAARLLDEYRTARDRAQRDLDFTVVRAPFDGVVGNRAVQVGQLVQPGNRLVALVPLDAVYVDANFKETQLGRIQPGQKVRIVVDAYPEEDFEGTVQSIAPASGSVFSLLPPENATGNFTKIVQRIPVRVALDPAATEKHELRPGMSVTAVVDTRTGGHS